jgi:hypothetical protein
LRPTVFALVVLLATLSIAGCKRHQEACASGDSPAVCQAFQQCLRSDVAVTVCSEGEKDANRKTDLAPAHRGDANALKY